MSEQEKDPRKPKNGNLRTFSHYFYWKEQQADRRTLTRKSQQQTKRTERRGP